MKANRLLIPVFLLIAGLAASISYEQSYQQVNAAYETKKIYSDSFENSEINDEWIKVNNVGLKQHYSSMRFTPHEYSWGSAITYHEKLSGNYKITFELQTSTMSNWFAIALGNEHYNSEFALAKGGFVFCDNNISNRLTAETGTLKADGLYQVSPFGFELKVRRTVEVEVQYIDAVQSKLQCSVYDDDVLVGTVFDEPLLYDNLDGYFCFNSCLKDVEIYNLTIHQEGELIYSDDFSTSEILYSTGGSFDSEWIANGFSNSDVKVGFINSLIAEDINSGVVYSSPLKTPENKDLDIAYIIESEIQYSPMDYNVVSGIEIAKNKQDSRGFFFGIEKSLIGYSLSVYGPNNEQIYVASTAKETTNMIIDLRMEIYLNGDVVFTAGELSHTVQLENYEGYIGLMTYSFKTGVEHGKGAYYKSFNLYKNDYYKRSSEDIYLNFNGTKKTYYEDIDEYAYDYWLPKSDYDIGTNVGLSKWNIKDKGDGKMEFNNSTNLSFFGPRGTYKDFVVKFDVQINSAEVPFAGCLGLKFGNSRNGAYIENSKSIGIGYYTSKLTGELATNPYITNVDFAPGAKEAFLDDDGNQLDIFKNQNKFTMMFVARNNTVSLHFLLDGEDESNLSKVRTSVVCRENESTDGHLSIYGGMGISFSIDNLSIINLDLDAPAQKYNGKSNYQEVTRLDFAKDNNTTGLDLTNANVNENTLKINEGGKVSTSKLVTDGILRLKLSNIGQELDIVQDQLQIKLINGENSYFTITDNSLTQKYELGSGYKFAGSIFELEKLDNHLIVRFVSGKDVLSKFDQSTIEFNINVDNTPSKLEIISVSGTAELEALTFINLNKYSSFVNRDYNEETDYFNPWPERNPIQGGSKKGCGGSITSSSFIILIISLLTLPILLLIRRAKR